MKILILAMFILAQFIAIMILIGLKLNTNITETDSYVVSFFIVNYGFLMVLCERFRQKYWRRKSPPEIKRWGVKIEKTDQDRFTRYNGKLWKVTKRYVRTCSDGKAYESDFRGMPDSEWDVCGEAGVC